MTFISKFHPKVKKFIDKLDKITRIRILNAIDELEADPFPRGCMKVEGAIPEYENKRHSVLE